MEGKSSDWLQGPSGPTVCRCCFAEGCYKDISTEYFWMGKKEVYAEMLIETYDINIAYAKTAGRNSNSRLICEPCISRLRDAAEFKRQVQECEKMFLQYLDPGRTSNMAVTPEMIEKDVKLEEVKQEKPHSDDDFDDRGGFDDDDDDLDDQPLTRLASKVPKKESVDILDLLDNAKAAVKRKSATKTSPAKKAKTKKDSPKATASKPKTEKKKKKEIIADRRTMRRKAMAILNHCTAYPFRYDRKTLHVQCGPCSNVFDDPNAFRAHMDTEHAIEHRAKIAARCGRGSPRVDITNLRCIHCLTPFTCVDTLVAHLNQIHKLGIDTNHHHGLVPMKLERNRFQCVLCPKVFTNLKMLWIHTGTHFWKIMCDICGNNYETVTGLKLHYKNVHTSGAKCKQCQTTFPTKEAKKEHVRTNKACYPTICTDCNERFLHWDQKMEHLINVHGKKRREFACTECDKKFKQRNELYIHFKVTHTEDNKCEYCGKLFPNKPTLEDHRASVHTRERNHTCKVCNAKFFTKIHLGRHLITHDDSKKEACPECGRLFARKYRLKAHIAKNHPHLNALSS